MKKEKIIVIEICIGILILLTGCAQGRQKQVHTAGTSSTAVYRAALQKSDSGDSNSSDLSTDISAENAESVAGTAQSDALMNALAGGSFSDDARDEYPYDIGADQKKYAGKKADIVVGDDLYMTQINDWFMNFKDYEGKMVSLEGYYIKYENYAFVGRNGPTCPYCTGGYVDFEFKSNEDFSDLKSGKSWICVKGILRQGYSYDSNGKKSSAFYYIEALNVDKKTKAGVDPIYD